MRSSRVRQSIIDACKACKAKVALAEYELSMTEVKAPSPGHVTHIYVRPGDFAAKRKPMFGVVEDGPWWVEANQL